MKDAPRTPLDGVPDMLGVMVRLRWWRFGVAEGMDHSYPMDARARWALRCLVDDTNVREVRIDVAHPASAVRAKTVLRRRHPDLLMFHLYEPSWTTWPLVRHAATAVAEAEAIIAGHQRRT